MEINNLVFSNIGYYNMLDSSIWGPARVPTLPADTAFPLIEVQMYSRNDPFIVDPNNSFNPIGLLQLSNLTVTNS